MGAGRRPPDDRAALEVVEPADTVAGDPFAGGRVAQRAPLPADSRPPVPDRAADVVGAGRRPPDDRAALEVVEPADPIAGDPFAGGREPQRAVRATQGVVPVPDRPAHIVPAGRRRLIRGAPKLIVDVDVRDRATGVTRVELLPPGAVLLVLRGQRRRQQPGAAVGVRLHHLPRVRAHPPVLTARPPTEGLIRGRPQGVQRRLTRPPRRGAGRAAVPDPPVPPVAGKAVEGIQVQRRTQHLRAGDLPSLEMQERAGLGRPTVIGPQPQISLTGLVGVDDVALHIGVERGAEPHLRVHHHRELHLPVLQEHRVRRHIQAHPSRLNLRLHRQPPRWAGLRRPRTTIFTLTRTLHR